MLNVKDLSVVYSDGTKAISGMNFELNAGENVALIGANGAGKTTLLHTIVGILEPSAGTVQVEDVILSKQSVNDVRKRIGLVFQNPDDQLFMPRIYDDIAFGPRNFGLPEDEIKSRVEESLRLLNAERLAERSPLKLSGGEKRVAAIATVLSMRPAIMLFDEPTAFLDPKARRTLTHLMNELPHIKLIATHDLDFAIAVCPRTILIKDGSVFADGMTKDLLANRELMESCGL